MRRTTLVSLTAALLSAWTHGSTGLPPSSFGGNPQYTVQSLTTDGVASFTLSPGSGGSSITATFDATGVNTSTSVITTNSPHGLAVGALVSFSTPGGGTLPSGATTTNQYNVNVISSTQLQFYGSSGGNIWRHAVNGQSDFNHLTTQGTGTGNLITDITYREYTNIALGSGSCAGVIATVYTQSSAVKGVYITNPGHGCTTSDTLTIPTLPSPDSGLTGASLAVTQVGLATSRTSARTPFFVQVSAKGIWATSPTGNGTIPFNGYEDLEYSWNFGDPSGTETFTRPTDGATVNANTDQIGPQAMYVYRRPGTFTITVTARGWNGSQPVVATKTQTVTATGGVPTKEVWFNPGGTGGNLGTHADPFTSTNASSSLLTFMDSAPLTKTDWVAHFARGSAFTGGRGLQASASTITGMRLDDCDDYTCVAKYEPNGPGAKPAFNSANDHPILIAPNGTPNVFNDITISNIAFNGSGTNGSFVNSTFGLHTFGYLDNVDITATGVANGSYTDILTGSGAVVGFGLYKVTVTGDAAAQTFGGAAQFVSLSCGVWYGVIGNTVTGGGGSNNPGANHGYYTFDSNFLPRDQVYYAWNTNGLTPSRVYLIKARMSYGGGGTSFIQNYASNINTLIENASETDTYAYTNANAIVDGNGLSSTGGFNAFTIYNGPTQQPSVTIRNNRAWGIANIFNPFSTTPVVTTTSFKVYKNKAYTAVAGVELGNFDSPTACDSAPPQYTCSPWTIPQQVTDNQFKQAAASQPSVFALAFSQFAPAGTAAGSQFLRNQYYASSTGPVTNVFGNWDNGIGGVYSSFGTWKSSTGLDTGTGVNASTFDNTGAIPPGWVTATPSQWSDFGP